MFLFMWRQSSICRKPQFPFTWMWFKFSHFKQTLPSDFHVSLPFPLCYHYSSTPTSSEAWKSVSDYLINRHHFSISVASKISSRIPRLDSFERSDSVINWLKDIGFLQNQLEIVVSRAPEVLLSDVDKTLKPKHKIFKEFGFPQNSIVDMIATDPGVIINRSVNRISTSFMVLKSVLASTEDISRLIKSCTWYLRYDLEKIFMVNIEFLQKDCRVSPLQIKRFLFSFPRFFLIQPECLKSVVQRVDEMKFGDKNSGMFLHAVRAVSALTAEKWEAKLELFRSLGMSDEEICCVFRKSPQVMVVSERKIMEIVDILFGSGKADVSILVGQPVLLMFSVEKRIKPRIVVLDLLEANNLIQRRPSLTSMLKMSNREFFGKFVHPYPQVLCKTDLLGKLQ